MTNFKIPLSLAGRLLLSMLFLPAGIGKITGFAGTVAYITSVGLPMPTLAAIIALKVEIIGGLALIAGFGTRIAALALALFTLVASFFFTPIELCQWINKCSRSCCSSRTLQWWVVC